MDESASLLNFSSVFLFGFLTFVAFLIWWLIKPWFSPLNRVPGPSKAHWLLGHMNLKFSSPERPFDLLYGWTNEFGGIVRYKFLLGRHRILIADPELLKYVYVTNGKNYKKANLLGLRQIVRAIGPTGLVFSNGEIHKRHRKILTPVFTNSSIKKLIPVFDEKVRLLVDHWKTLTNSKEVTEIFIRDDVSRMTLEAIGVAAFGFDFKCIRAESELSKRCKGLLDSGPDMHDLTRFIPFFEYIPTAKNRQYWENLKALHDCVDGMIAQKMKLLDSDEGSESAAKDLLGMMLVAKDPETGEKLNANELRDETITFLFAGHETTSLGISWTLLELANHQQIQAQIREEIVKMLPDEEKPLTAEDFDRLPLLRRAVNEALRLHDPAPASMRQAIADDYVGGYFIPKGTIMLCIHGMVARKSEFFDRPDDFQPDRFEKEEEFIPYSFIPFSAGPRMCIGFRFAILEILVSMTNLIRNFQFFPHPTIKYGSKLVITQAPEPSLRLMVRKI